MGGPMNVTTGTTGTDVADEPTPVGADLASQRGRRRVRRRPRGRRGLLDRITMSTVVGLVAALLVFVLTAVLLRDRRELVSVAVASERIPAGTTITPAMVHEVE